MLIAVGAILHWAVSDHISGVSLVTVGTILLIVGIVGLVISLIFAMGWYGRRDETVVRDRYVDRPPV